MKHNYNFEKSMIEKARDHFHWRSITESTLQSYEFENLSYECDAASLEEDISSAELRDHTMSLLNKYIDSLEETGNVFQARRLKRYLQN